MQYIYLESLCSINRDGSTVLPLQSLRDAETSGTGKRPEGPPLEGVLCNPNMAWWGANLAGLRTSPVYLGGSWSASICVCRKDYKEDQGRAGLAVTFLGQHQTPEHSECSVPNPVLGANGP